MKTITNVAKRVQRSRRWGLIGGVSILAAFLILSYYLVIAGWVFDYFFRAILGQFKQATEISAINSFKTLQADYWEMFLTDTLLTLAMIGVIALGVKRGLERTVMILFPALLLLMIVLLIYSVTSGGFHQAVVFLFEPNFHQVTPKVVLMALGQAFFSLNIAMAINIMFSAYLPEDTPVSTSVMAVCFADTAIALLAGLIIFPVVFAYHLQPASGPSLIFRTLPIAFGHIPFGNVVGALFFLLLLFAAFTSAISLLEPMVAWLMENHHFSRKKAAGLSGTACWILSFGSILSFSHSAYIQVVGVTFFKAIDFLTSGIMLPVGGLLIAIFTGWIVPKQLIQDELGWNPCNGWFLIWRWIQRYFAPVAIILILLTSFGII